MLWMNIIEWFKFLYGKYMYVKIWIISNFLFKFKN